jgi:hypothetical protein
MDEQSGRTFNERIETTGAELADRVKELARQADTRRVVIRDQTGKELISLPLTWGVAGGALAVMAAPFLAAVAAIGGAVAKVRLEVERVGAPDSAPGSAQDGTARGGWVEDDPDWGGHAGAETDDDPPSASAG